MEVDEKLMVKRAKRGEKPEIADIREPEDKGEQMSIDEIGKEYDKYEAEMFDKYHQDNVYLIRDWFKKYFVKYADGYKDLIAETSKDDGYDDVQEWLDDEYLDLFPTDLKVDSDYAIKALEEMKEIEQNWIDYLDENNMAPGPDNESQIIPSRFF